MPLISQSYGKGRVRAMRAHRDGDCNEVRELTVEAMLQGGFKAACTEGDNRAVVATDTMKNIACIVARENLAACAGDYAAAFATRLLARYPHSFVLDGNGQPTAMASAGRDGPVRAASGLSGYTFMKSTASGWVGHVMDDRTTLPETRDRLAATAMGRGMGLAVLGLAVPAPHLRGHQCLHPGRHAGGVRHHLQPRHPGQPVPHGRGGVGGAAGN